VDVVTTEVACGCVACWHAANANGKLKDTS
jgi:hypothetical protein